MSLITSSTRPKMAHMVLWHGEKVHLFQFKKELKFLPGKLYTDVQVQGSPSEVMPAFSSPVHSTQMLREVGVHEMSHPVFNISPTSPAASLWLVDHDTRAAVHVPWRMMTYKALNTFIDDLFAFIIKMPTLYRLGITYYSLLVHLTLVPFGKNPSE